MLQDAVESYSKQIAEGFSVFCVGGGQGDWEGKSIL